MGCAMYSVSLSLASPAFPLAMSSAPVLLGQGNPHPTRVRVGLLSCLIEQPPLGVPVPPKPTGALEIFFVHCFLPLSGAAFRLFSLKNIKPLAHPASPPPTIAAGGSGDYRTGRSRLMLAEAAAPLAACRCSWAGAVALLGPEASPGRMRGMRRQPGFTLSITCSSAQCCCKNKPKEEGSSGCTQPSGRHRTESRAWRR